MEEQLKNIEKEFYKMGQLVKAGKMDATVMQKRLGFMNVRDVYGNVWHIDGSSTAWDIRWVAGKPGEYPKRADPEKFVPGAGVPARGQRPSGLRQAASSAAGPAGSLKVAGKRSGTYEEHEEQEEVVKPFWKSWGLIAGVAVAVLCIGAFMWSIWQPKAPTNLPNGVYVQQLADRALEGDKTSVGSAGQNDVQSAERFKTYKTEGLSLHVTGEPTVANNQVVAQIELIGKDGAVVRKSLVPLSQENDVWVFTKWPEL